MQENVQKVNYTLFRFYFHLFHFQFCCLKSNMKEIKENTKLHVVSFAAYIEESYGIIYIESKIIIHLFNDYRQQLRKRFVRRLKGLFGNHHSKAKLNSAMH